MWWTKLTVSSFCLVVCLALQCNIVGAVAKAKAEIKDDSLALQVDAQWAGAISLQPKAYHQGAGLFIDGVSNISGISFWAFIPSNQPYLHENKYLMDLRPDNQMYLSTKSNADNMHGVTLVANRQQGLAVFENLVFDQWTEFIFKFETPISGGIHLFERYNHQEFLSAEVGAITLWRSVTNPFKMSEPPRLVALSVFQPALHEHRVTDRAEFDVIRSTTPNDTSVFELKQYECSDCFAFATEPRNVPSIILSYFYFPSALRHWNIAASTRLVGVFAELAKVVPSLVSVRSEACPQFKNTSCVAVRVAVDASVAASVQLAFKRSLLSVNMVDAIREVGMDDEFVDWIEGPNVVAVNPVFSPSNSAVTLGPNNLPFGKTHPNPKRGVVDQHGCEIGQGFSWCESYNKCVQDWENGIGGPCPVCLFNTTWCDTWQRCIAQTVPCPSETSASRNLPVRLGQDDPLRCLESHVGGPGYVFCPAKQACIQNWEGGEGYPCESPKHRGEQDNILDTRFDIKWNKLGADPLCFRNVIASLLQVTKRSDVNVHLGADHRITEVTIVTQGEAETKAKKSQLSQLYYDGELLVQATRCGVTTVKLLEAKEAGDAVRTAMYASFTYDAHPNQFEIAGDLILQGLVYTDTAEDIHSTGVRIVIGKLCGVEPHFVTTVFSSGMTLESTAVSFIVQPSNSSIDAVTALAKNLTVDLLSADFVKALRATGLPNSVSRVNVVNMPKARKTQRAILDYFAKNQMAALTEMVATTQLSREFISIVYWTVTPSENENCLECADKAEVQFRFEAKDPSAAHDLYSKVMERKLISGSGNTNLSSDLSGMTVRTAPTTVSEFTFLTEGVKLHSSMIGNFSLHLEGVDLHRFDDAMKLKINLAATAALHANTSIVSVKTAAGNSHAVVVHFEVIAPLSDLKVAIASLSSTFFSTLMGTKVTVTVSASVITFERAVYTNFEYGTVAGPAKLSPSPSPQPSQTPTPNNLPVGASVEMIDFGYGLFGMGIAEFTEAIQDEFTEAIGEAFLVNPSDVFVFSRETHTDADSTLTHVRILVRNGTDAQTFLNKLKAVPNTLVTNLFAREPRLFGWTGGATRVSSVVVKGPWRERGKFDLPPSPSPNPELISKSNSLSSSRTPSLTASPSPSSSLVYSPSITPSPEAFLVGGTIMIEIEMEKIKGPEFTKIAPKIRETLAKIVDGAALASVTERYEVKNLSDIKEYLSAPVMLVAAKARATLGHFVDVLSVEAQITELRNEVVFNVAIPIVSDSYLDGNYIAQAVLDSILQGSLRSSIQAPTGVSYSFSLTQPPRWNPFSDTKLVAILKTPITLTDRDHERLAHDTPMESILITSISKMAGVPSDWITLEKDIQHTLSETSVIADVAVPIDRVRDALNSTAAKISTGSHHLQIAMSEEKLKIEEELLVHASCSAPTVEYRLVPANYQSESKRVFITASHSVPYDALLTIPGSPGTGIMRGHPMPVAAGTDTSSYEIHLHINRPVELLLTPTRDTTPLRNLFD